MNVGIAGHITAAAPGGPRFDPSLTSAERASLENGIWLCAGCAALVDRDPTRYTVALLNSWKAVAEEMARIEVANRVSVSSDARFAKAEAHASALLAEMRADLLDSPSVREFLLKRKGWGYWSAPGEELFAYYFEEHPALTTHVRLLEQLGLVHDRTRGDVGRYVLDEEFVDYLMT